MYGGTSFHQVEKLNESESDRIENQFVGAGYCTKRGLVNLQFNVNNDHYTVMTEEQLDAHIVRVIIAQQHGLNKGIQLFGDKANVAVHKELKQIHELETYEPMLASDLSWEDKEKDSGSLLFIK